MIAFLQCVAEGFAEQGLQGLVKMVPGGNYVLGACQSALKKYRERRNQQAIRDDLQKLAQQGFAEARRAAEEVAREVAQKAPIEDRIQLEMILTGIPAAVRQAMKRPEDPSGTTVPAAFVLRDEDDLVKLLPARVPRFRPGVELPRRPGWVLNRQLGVGGFGEVWLAVNREAEHLKLAVKFGRDADADRDLMNERDVIRRLMAATPHASLVPLKDVSFDGEVPWLAYEYVDGGDLADQIRGWQALPKEQKAARAGAGFRELVEAVARLHEQGIVHRDLKPSNILVESGTGRLRVTDFGISGIAARNELRGDASGTTTRAGRLLSCIRGAHTPLYASPQQKDNASADFRDDVHAVGVIAYQMFTGKLDRAPGVDIVNDMVAAGASKDLIRLVASCVSGEPTRRPKNGSALFDKLSEIDGDVELVEVAVPLTPARPSAPPPKSKPSALRAKRPDPPPRPRPQPRPREDRRQEEPQASGCGAGVVLVVLLFVILGVGAAVFYGMSEQTKTPATKKSPYDPPPPSRFSNDKPWIPEPPPQKVEPKKAVEPKRAE